MISISVAFSEGGGGRGCKMFRKKHTHKVIKFTLVMYFRGTKNSY